MLVIMVERRYRERAREKGESEGKENLPLCFLHSWNDFYASFYLKLISLAAALLCTLVAYFF